MNFTLEELVFIYECAKQQVEYTANLGKQFEDKCRIAKQIIDKFNNSLVSINEQNYDTIEDMIIRKNEMLKLIDEYKRKLI